ncbi:hypothetical protein JXA02_00905 [candidate division KSB1 bacterium]|nr:hypothetical protein [candidate division KSB1 bacterium]
MSQLHSYRAPWGRSLKLMTLFGSVILIGIPLFSLSAPPDEKTARLIMLGIPLTILIGVLLFIIRSYELENGALKIRRLLWRTVIDLGALQDIEIKPNAMAGSIRTFGNGGFFSFSGLFKNKELGSYRAFVTDPRQCIVLRFPNRVIVVSPDRQNEFVAIVKDAVFKTRS